MIYVRDTIDKFVLCENYTIRFTTKDAGLMQPPKPVLELLTVESHYVDAVFASGG